MIDSETHKLLEAHGLTAYTIERQAGHVTEQAIVALIEQVRVQARREALEEACKALCMWCQGGLPTHYTTHDFARGGWWMHIALDGDEPYDVMCTASPIRALMAREE